MISGGVLMFLVSIGSSLLAFLSQRIILSTLTKEENGSLFVERRLGELVLIILVDFGMNAVAMRRINVEPHRQKEIVSSLLAYRFLLFVPSALLAAGIGWTIGYEVHNVVFWCIAMFLMSRSGLIRYAMELPDRAQHRFVVPSLVTLLDGTLYAALVYSYRHELTVSTAIVLMIFAAIPGFVISTITGGRRSFFMKYVTWSEIQALVKASLPVVASVILLSIHDKIDAFFVEGLAGKLQAGVFGAAYGTLAPLTQSIPLTMALTLAPAIARASVENIANCRQLAIDGLRFTFSLSIVISSSLAIVSGVIIDVISGGVYRGHELEFASMMWVCVPVFIQVYLYEVQIALGAQRSIVRSNLVLLAVTIVGCVTLIPTFGAQGAIVSKILSVASASVVILRAFHLTVGQAVSLKLAVNAVFVLAATLGMSFVLPYFVSPVVAAPIAVVGSITLLMLTRFVTMADIASIVSLLRNRA